MENVDDGQQHNRQNFLVYSLTNFFVLQLENINVTS